MFHIAGGVFFGIVGAIWFLTFIEKRKAKKIARAWDIRKAELSQTKPAPIEMYFAEPRPTSYRRKSLFPFWRRLMPLVMASPPVIGMAVLYFFFH